MSPGPDFVGIGVQKAATTWLYKRLAMHPDIYFPCGKEVHFWDRRDRKNIPVSRYTSRFSGPQIEHIGGKTGEITPSYMLISNERIREIHAALPDVRLILMLRNPIDRAVSAAHMVLRGRSVTAKQQPEEFDRILRSRYIGNCGDYMTHIRRWLDVFPASQLHVILQDDIADRPTEALQAVVRHIGVSDVPYELIDDQLLSAPVAARGGLQPTADQRAWLSDRYRDEINALADYIDRPLDHWLKTESQV